MGSWHFPNRCGAEIDISVSKLLGFETFANFLRVSVSENLVSEKSLGIGFGKFGIGKKVSVSVSENLVSEKKSRYRFLKPIPRLFFRYQIFRNRYRDFFSDTKFSETDTETSFPIPNFPRPKPILLNIFYIFYNFWTDTQLNELLPTNNGLVHIVHILRNTNFWSPETPLPLCNIVMNFDDP